MTDIPVWFLEARARIEARRPKPEIMDTPEKAAAEGVPIGTTVLRYSAPTLTLNPQHRLDDMCAEECMRAFPDLWNKSAS